MPYMINIMSNLASRLNNPNVVAVAYDGLCTFEFGVVVEMFGLPRPEMGQDWYKFAVASIETGELRATGGVRVLADGGLDLFEQAGTIIMPGWRGVEHSVPQRLVEALQKAHANGARILSICSGVFVLAAAGLLSGRRATTHWRYADLLTERYPDIRFEPNVLYVDEGSILTSAGSAAGIDLCLHLIRRDFGTEAANKVARRMVVAPHRDGGQAQFVEQAVPAAHEGARLSPLLELMRNNIQKEFSIASLAKAAGMSPRTFLRRFDAATGMTPARWLLSERLGKARDLLENSPLSVEVIAANTGFGTAATLRHHFRQQLATTPTAYRDMFGKIPELEGA
ncbi:transcriptional regulator containing an amidase domain and an AraC-type DNA-binding HTH domain [Phyllobacterium sp. YR531]|nr:transcriptional regulator containing an amidase domain and an AraC-type DNA-binding HTH domain [Phyllobacterium sp. YR531]